MKKLKYILLIVLLTGCKKIEEIEEINLEPKQEIVENKKIKIEKVKS